MFSLLSQNPVSFVIIAVLLIAAISVHEFSHAFSADHLGDPTPRLAGRLTLDPRAHLDPMGTLLLFFVGFGWGKPVPFDPFNLKDPKRDSALISFAGPLSNLLMAILASVIIRLTNFLPLLLASSIATQVLSLFVYFNVLLAIFNLLPVHPLDGFKVVAGLLPKKYYSDWLALEPYGMFFLIMLIFPFFGRSAVSQIISPVISFILSILLPGSLGGMI
ncbi:hypothetical protein A3D03_02965 [Candidatus Gottesmanbacteria bacterium RIFCSPHIGHO2_02_FULL_40_13]|uniref:Peptidase M50 domain-containing protein n=1 Tax=Candidatus Gottesmanbacteria bacterium RIFCSPHIGHO2_02_FULL_40_13 TaxID=1798384 RepID=A0A1F6A9N7_9BACT|nr:MAG: hypothetical protein A3D03_02965 [Candidatus Gottesmanbacteria bacterium RIFCSPHIGHO2_02_FULL_40_13]